LREMISISPPASLEAQSSQRNLLFPFSAERAEKGKTSRFAYALSIEKALPKGHAHFSLPSSQRQRKNESFLRSLRLCGEILAV